MPILLEGVGDDWVVTRRPRGGPPELSTFSSLAEFQQVMQRLLVKAAKAPPPSMVVEAQEVAQAPIEPLATIPPRLMSLPPETDCRSCGACCAPSDQSKPHHVRLDVQDIEAIPATFRDSFVTRNGDGHSYLTTKANAGLMVCVALSGAVGGSCRCGIYARRPMVCQLFEPGSPECLKARSAMEVR